MKTAFVELTAEIDMRHVHSGSIAPYALHLLSAAATVPRDALAVRRFHLPYLDVNVGFSDESYAELCDEGLAGRAMRDDQLRSTVNLTVMSASGGDWPEPAGWREPSFSPVTLDRVITGHQLRGYYYHEHRFWQFYDPAAGRGVQSMIAADRFAPWESSGPLRAFLHWAYDGLGMRLAHAASLGLDGRGVLLAGRGGSGKSGTTLAGIVDGLATVGDDYVLLDRGGVRHAYSVFAKMKQDIVGLRRVGLRDSQLGDAVPNWQNKIEFDPGRVRREASVNRMEISAILLPRIEHRRRTCIEPARAAEAMLALAPSGLFQMPGCAASGVRFYSDFVRQIPAFHLLLSEDPGDIARCVRGFLARKGLARAA